MRKFNRYISLMLCLGMAVLLLSSFALESHAVKIVEEETTTSALNIPSDAVEWNGHYYKRIDLSGTWENARIQCMSQGGHLATITSAEEQAFVVSMLADAPMNLYWLGSRLNTDWAWVTGEAFEYANWGPGEPNDEGGDEAYVQIYAKPFRSKVVGDWNDATNHGAEYSAEFYKTAFTGYICEWDILDSDGDGLYDHWEIDGIDTDGDGIAELPLDAMGADPYVKDIFVEVDWMVRPQEKFLFWETQSKRSMKASDEAFRMVYQAFRNQGINLHIDAGPNSTDYVTGELWGSLSGGNEIPYAAMFDLSNWESVAGSNFATVREMAFKHCIFVERFDEAGHSGLALGIPEQYFLVANMDWVHNGGNISVGGTFMHELGHTLGLGHGGEDHEHYKANYLSIMNYLFQTEGLRTSGGRRINYSEYQLPDLDEMNLDENNGIDPDNLLAGTGLGTGWYLNGAQIMINNVAGSSIDFDQDGNIETGLNLDINDDGITSILAGSKPDWDILILTGGRIGDMTALGKAMKFKTEEMMSDELTLEKALENQTLAYPGDGHAEPVSTTLLAGSRDQFLYLDISNRSAVDVTFTLTVDSEIAESVSMDVEVPASLTAISSARVAVPVKDGLEPGEYEFTCSLSSAYGETMDFTYILTVYEPSEEELTQMLAAMENGELDEAVADEDLREQITKAVTTLQNISNEEQTIPQTDPIAEVEPDDGNCPCRCHSENFLSKIFYSVLRFFWKLFGVNEICGCGEQHY